MKIDRSYGALQRHVYKYSCRKYLSKALLNIINKMCVCKRACMCVCEVGPTTLVPELIIIITVIAWLVYNLLYLMGIIAIL